MFEEARDAATPGGTGPRPAHRRAAYPEDST